jgi:anti-sigma regulatory factor (Ser/Thr protein kinase)
MAPAPGASSAVFAWMLALSAEGAMAGLQAAEDFLAAGGVTARSRDRVALVLEEALMNLVMHGARVGRVRSASFQISLQGTTIELKVLDDGLPFDPREQVLPALATSLESAAPGGQGLRLMQRFVRELHYAKGERGNCLTLLLDRN